MPVNVRLPQVLKISAAGVMVAAICGQLHWKAASHGIRRKRR